ncbi:Phosphotyrosyl phosphatase activator [Exidia glandulosa HHB12029]|uniref:Serine/threonine-protein phosphatase 2A activator n=1 Tax=Exidia glandulosa HHB12029 TaxID=1314781 RepID=A0A165MB40_EXIGL|nr:Phosphotyrosyl phosphatase activator [Exidia glandulosa HHB12029]
MLPRKILVSKEQLAEFEQSGTHAQLVAYIQALNDAVIGVKLTDECACSEGIHAIIRVLDDIDRLVDATPPVDNAGSRFGNPAFRSFYDKVQELATPCHAALPGLQPDAVPELAAYLSESWGSRTRIDYGSGMELNFLCWLFCLERLGVVRESDHTALVTRVFWRYMQIMRRVQSSYWLEPAGSHGVWGLDDYHFLPFLFGSAQLRGHKYLRPKSIHDEDVLMEYSKYYMYLACIQFINSIKTASLRWHSPMLDDISAVKTWDKVNSGMIKMYKAEVLGKLPVMQHFLFGSLLPWEGSILPETAVEEPDEHGHVHVKGEATWGDCCGIPVPSAFGAAVAQKGLSGPSIRPVPFD